MRRVVFPVARAATAYCALPFPASENTTAMLTIRNDHLWRLYVLFSVLGGRSNYFDILPRKICFYLILVVDNLGSQQQAANLDFRDDPMQVHVPDLPSLRMVWTENDRITSGCTHPLPIWVVTKYGAAGEN